MEQRNPLILITGGAGYIGSVLAELLLQHGHRVRIADQLLFGRAGLDSLGTHSNLEFFQGDLRDATFVEKATNGVQIVVHLAAIVGDEACRKFSVLAHETNTVAAEQLWNQCRKSGVAHFIFASTCSNYGIMADESNLLHEDSPLNPVSDYALQKTGFEQFLLSQPASGMAFTILRFATAYGVSPRMRFDLTVNHFTRDLSLGRPLEVFGAKLWRPYAHIGDLAEAVRCVINEGPAATDRKIYNTGAPTENYSKESIVNEVLKLVPDAQVHYAGNATNDLRNYRVDFSRIHAELGFEPKWNVAAGVKEVHKLVTSGFISDPFNPIYKNA